MRILIVEDDPGVQGILIRGLREKQVKVDAAHDGKEALTMLTKNTYDLAIVDLMLPQIGGERIIQKIRQVGLMLPILVLTALRHVETKARLLELGADDFLHKPFSFEELFARISAILRRVEGAELRENVRIGDLELLPEKRMVKRAGKEIPLRGKEYNLLAYMMRHPRQALSRQKLLENVWGYCKTVLSNTVDSHVFNLRKKIDTGHDKKYIRTVHGMGYMLSD